MTHFRALWPHRVLFLQDIIMYIQFIAEFSELIHVDKRKDKPESTSSSVELCSYSTRSFISRAVMLLLKTFV